MAANPRGPSRGIGDRKVTFQVAVENEAVAAGLSFPMARKALAERSDMLHKVFAEAGEAMDPAAVKSQEFKDGAEMATWIRNVNNELTFIGKRVSEADELDKVRRENDERQKNLRDFQPAPGGFAPGEKKQDRPVFKGIGDVFVESKAIEAAKGHRNGSFELEDADAKAFLLESKTVFETGAGWAPQSLRTGRVVLDEQREVEVTDILPVFPTNQAAIVYMEETTFTNAAAERAEGGAYAESAFALTQRTVTVRSVGTSLPVTDEQLEDVEGVRAYLNQRMGFAVRQRVDTQVIAGDGIAPNLLGTLAVGSINSQAKSTDNVPDAVYKGADLVRVTGRAQPNVVLFHPTDWQPVRLLKTTDGVYIWGSPSEAGPARIWGLPVVLSTAVTQNTAIVGDYARFAGLHVKKGLVVETGYTNDDFTDGRITVRAGMRLAIVHYRAAAFTQVTGV